MILDSVHVTSLNAKIIEGILTLIPDASVALKENDFAKFVDITNTIQTCSEHTYKQLQDEIKNHVFDVSWDAAMAEGNLPEIAALADKWKTNMIASCKQHLI